MANFWYAVCVQLRGIYEQASKTQKIWKVVWILEDTLRQVQSRLKSQILRLCGNCAVQRGPSNWIRISLYHFFWSLAHSCSYTWPGRSTQPNCRSAITCPWTCQQRTCYVERLQNVPLSPFAPCGIFGDMILGDVNLKPQWNYLSFSFKVARQP